jgi:hypothetical protein
MDLLLILLAVLPLTRDPELRLNPVPSSPNSRDCKPVLGGMQTSIVQRRPLTREPAN